MEVAGRGIRVVARAIVVTRGISGFKSERPRCKVEHNTALVVGGSARWAYSYGVQHGSSTGDRHRHTEGTIGFGWRAGHCGLAVGVRIRSCHVDGIARR